MLRAELKVLRPRCGRALRARVNTIIPTGGDACLRRYREISYGMGHVDFEAIIRKTYGMNVRRYPAEFWYTGQTDWEAELSGANQFLRDKFSAAGV